MFFTVLTAVAILNRTPNQTLHSAGDTVLFRLVWEVASNVHPAGDSLGELSGVAVDSWGNVYVSDFSAARIWLFDSRGRFVRSLGRQGQGPGEYRAPTGIAIDSSERLYVRDTYRITRYRPDPTVRRIDQIDQIFPGPPNADWRSTRATRFDRAGRMYYPGHKWLADGTALRFFVRFVPGHRELDTVFVPRYSNEPQLTAHVRMTERSGRMLPGLSIVPFATRPAWDVTTNGSIISGDAKTYLLRESDTTGKILREYRRTTPLEKVSEREFHESTTALERRLDSVSAFIRNVRGMPPEVRDRRIPRTLPAYVAVYSSIGDSVWVRRWPSSGRKETVFDVFESSGRFVCTVVLPRAVAIEPSPVLSLRRVVAIAIDPETGEHSVVVFDGPRAK